MPTTQDHFKHTHTHTYTHIYSHTYTHIHVDLTSDKRLLQVNLMGYHLYHITRYHRMLTNDLIRMLH